MEVDNSLTNLNGYLPSFCEGEMPHEIGILIHGENGETHGFEWHGKELDYIFLAFFSEVVFILFFAEPATGLEYGVDVFGIVWIAAK